MTGASVETGAPRPSSDAQCAAVCDLLSIAMTAGPWRTPPPACESLQGLAAVAGGPVLAANLVHDSPPRRVWRGKQRSPVFVMFSSIETD